MTRALILFTLLIATTLPLAGQSPPYIAPGLSYAWIATACEEWSCAAAAMALADGDGSVIALPTDQEKYPWLLLRKVVAGSVVIAPEEPYVAEGFTTAGEALARYSAIGEVYAPMLLARKESHIVVSLRQPRLRSVRR